MKKITLALRPPTRRGTLVLWALLAAAVFLPGCATYHSRARHNASVVDFLFPAGAAAPVTLGTSVLNLPLKVGVAFVPASAKERNFYTPEDSLSEAKRLGLLKEIARHFEEYKFVKEIEVIPSAYLRPGGSFANMDQIAGLFGVDVVALVSYDQMQFNDQDFTSFLYWTIIGPYVIQAEKNDTQTMLDAVVYDVPSRTMLFRAPGVSQIKHRSTKINLSEQLRKDAEAGFESASTDLVTNLKAQLALFQEKAKNRPEDYKIVHREGYKGGGAFGWGELTIALILIAVGIVDSWKAAHKKSNKS